MNDTHEDVPETTNETTPTLGDNQPNPFAHEPAPTAEETAADVQAEHDKREEAVAGVVTSCSDAIAGLVDADGHEDRSAINLVMLRLRHAFGG